jgi:hypothetical protein
MASVLVEEVKVFGLDIIIGVNLVYIILVWTWKPYHHMVNFHNKAIKFNHVTTFVFALVCELIRRV